MLLLSGCASEPRIADSKLSPWPQWYINPPQNSATQLFGTGTADERQAAEKQALGNLIERLSVSIKSTWTRASTSYRDSREYTQTEIKDHLSSRSLELQLPNYQVLENEQLADRSRVVMVSVSTSDLLGVLQQEYEDLLWEVRRHTDQSQNLDPISRWLALRHSAERINRFAEKNGIREHLSRQIGQLSEEQGMTYGDHRVAIAEALADVEKRLRVRLVIDQQSEQFRDVVTQALLAAGIQIASATDPTAQVLRVTSDISTREIAGIVIATAGVQLRFMGRKQQLVRAQTINLKAASSVDPDLAVKNLTDSLQRYFAERKLPQALGLNYQPLI